MITTVGGPAMENSPKGVCEPVNLLLLRGYLGSGSKGGLLCAMCPVKVKVGANWRLGSVSVFTWQEPGLPEKHGKGQGSVGETPTDLSWLWFHSMWACSTSVCPGTLVHLLGHGGFSRWPSSAPCSHPIALAFPAASVLSDQDVHKGLRWG